MEIAECSFPDLDFNVKRWFLLSSRPLSSVAPIGLSHVSSILSSPLFPLPAHAVQLCLGKDRQKPLAMHFSHLCQVAQPSWKCGFPVSTCSSVAPSFLSLHCFHILSHCLLVWCSLPHPSTFICISLVQSNIMIGCHISHRRESHSQQDPRKWKGTLQIPNNLTSVCSAPSVW